MQITLHEYSGEQWLPNNFECWYVITIVMGGNKKERSGGRDHPRNLASASTKAKKLVVKS